MKKVHFACKTTAYLIPIFKEERESRQAPWMQTARDRHCFQQKFWSCAKLIEVLS